MVAETLRQVGPSSKELYGFLTPKIFRILELILKLNRPDSLIPEKKNEKMTVLNWIPFLYYRVLRGLMIY